MNPFPYDQEELIGLETVKRNFRSVPTSPRLTTRDPRHLLFPDPFRFFPFHQGGTEIVPVRGGGNPAGNHFSRIRSQQTAFLEPEGLLVDEGVLVPGLLLPPKQKFPRL